MEGLKRCVGALSDEVARQTLYGPGATYGLGIPALLVEAGKRVTVCDPPEGMGRVDGSVRCLLSGDGLGRSEWLSPSPRLGTERLAPSLRALGMTGTALSLT